MSEVEQVLSVVRTRTDNKVISRLTPPDDWDASDYAKLIADLARIVARSFEIDEDEVWKMVRYRSESDEEPVRASLD